MSVAGVHAPSSVVEVNGDLEALAEALRSLEPESRSCVVGHLADGDYLLDVDLPDRRVRMRATLREERPAGGTWWTTRSLAAPAESHGDPRERLAEEIARAIHRLRRDFARMLQEASSIAPPLDSADRCA